MKDYIRGKDGLPISTNSDNIRYLLKGLGLTVRWNAWLERIEIKGGNSFTPNMAWSDWTRVDDAAVSRLIAHARRTETNFNVGKDFLWDCLTSFAHANPADPVLDRIDQLEGRWDGERRLDRWLIETCGTPDDAYHRAVGKVIIGGAVLRARQPGAKFDTMPIFYGAQGSGKSTLAQILALEKGWFTDAILLGAESKELVLALAGILIAEVSEMGARSTVNVNSVKAMLSRSVDRGRTAYARVVTDRPRRNIFIGTSNDNEPLSDPTGNRRFLPIAVEQPIRLDWLCANIDQLYGEAATLESNGEMFQLPRDVWVAATAAQDAVTEQPAWQIFFSDWFARTSLDVFVTASDLAEFARAAAHPRTVRTGEYLSFMRTKLGFREDRKWVGGKTVAIYVRGETKGATRIVPRRELDGRTKATLFAEIETTQPNVIAPVNQPVA